MTVIAAYANADTLVMAADTGTSYGGTKISGSRKIYRLTVPGAADVLLAGSGNAAMGAYLAHNLELPSSSSDVVTDLQTWADQVAFAVTAALAHATPAVLQTGDNNVQSIDGTGILGHAGRLWYLFTHEAVPVPDGIAAIGSGSELALGALHGQLAADPAASPIDMVTTAVTLACRFDPWCGLDATGPLVETLDR